jgi:hypothetical protein
MFRLESVTATQSFRVNSHLAFRYPGVPRVVQGSGPLTNVEQ